MRLYVFFPRGNALQQCSRLRCSHNGDAAFSWKPTSFFSHGDVIIILVIIKWPKHSEWLQPPWRQVLKVNWAWQSGDYDAIPSLKRAKRLGNKQEEEKLSLVGFCNFSFQLHSRLFSCALDRKRFFQSHKFKRPERPCLTNKFQELLGKISMQHFLCAWQTFQHQKSWTIPISLLLGSAQRFVVFSIIILLTNLGFPIIFVNIEWLNFSNIILNFDLSKIYLDLHYKSQYS